ncbi:MAG TPA: flavoprotein [Pseudonocardiaceae bacterium]|nr:flavoprotein [Pseudonocardiaceae bacterium]
MPARAARTAFCTTWPFARACWFRPLMPEYLALIACGAPLAARVHDVAAHAVEVGWIVRVAATPSAMNWVDADRVEEITGFGVLVEHRRPGQAKRFAPPAQVIVCPATFNTVNKLAVGIMDNYATGLLCEALALRTPIIIAPMVNNRLWPHPAWQHNLDLLAAAGVRFIDIHTGHFGRPTAVQSGTGSEVIAAFEPAWVLAPASGQPAQKS